MERPFKRTTFSLLFGAIFLPTGVLAQSDPWQADTVSYTSWNTTDKECKEWIPSRHDVDWGVPLRQSSTCRLTDTRDRVFKEKHQYTGEVRVRSVDRETRIRQVNEWRTTYGLHDRIINVERATDWGAWGIDRSTLHNCQWQQPDLSEQVDLGRIWVRSRQCEAEAERRKPIYQYWLSGKTTRLLAEESRETSEKSVVDTFWSHGQNDRWLPPVTTHTKWNSTGEKQCASISPSLEAAADTADWGGQVLIPVACEQPLERQRIVKQSRLSGESKIIEKNRETRTQQNVEWRVRFGLNDSVISKGWRLADDWFTVASSVVCDGVDLTGVIDWGQRYLDYQVCQATEARNHHLIATYRSGKQKILDKEQETRPTTVISALWQVGEKDRLIADQVEQRVTDWQSDGSLRCGNWEPSPHLVDVGVDFYQTRLCEQTQQRYVESLSRWRSGDKWVRTEREIQQQQQWYVKENVGSRTISHALEPITLSLGAQGSVVLSRPIVAEGMSRYDRMRVEVTVKGVEKGAVSLSIQSRSGSIQMPDINEAQRMFFFRLNDYDITDRYEFKLQGAGRDGQKVKVEIYLESQ